MTATTTTTSPTTTTIKTMMMMTTELAPLDFPHDYKPNSPLRKHRHHIKDNFIPPQKPPATEEDMKRLNEVCGVETFANLILHDGEYDMSPKVLPEHRPSPPLSPKSDAARRKSHHMKDLFEPVDRIMTKVVSPTTTTATTTATHATQTPTIKPIPPPKHDSPHHSPVGSPHRHHHHHHHHHHGHHHRKDLIMFKSKSAPIGSLSAPSTPYDVSRENVSDEVLRRFSYQYGEDAARQKRLADLEMNIPILM